MHEAKSLIGILEHPLPYQGQTPNSKKTNSPKKQKKHFRPVVSINIDGTADHIDDETVSSDSDSIIDDSLEDKKRPPTSTNSLKPRLLSASVLPSHFTGSRAKFYNAEYKKNNDLSAKGQLIALNQGASNHHLLLVSLLSFCAEGKNAYTEILCQKLIALDDCMNSLVGNSDQAYRGLIFDCILSNLCSYICVLAIC